jgi:hypothetical protein
MRQQSVALYTSRELRKVAKEEADARLIEQILQADEQMARSSDPDPQPDTALSDSFEIVRESKVAALPTKKWGEV